MVDIKIRPIVSVSVCWEEIFQAANSLSFRSKAGDVITKLVREDVEHGRKDRKNIEGETRR